MDLLHQVRLGSDHLAFDTDTETGGSAGGSGRAAKGIVRNRTTSSQQAAGRVPRPVLCRSGRYLGESIWP